VSTRQPLTRRQETTKRALDVVVAAFGLALGSPLLAVAWLVATVSTRRNGLFRQDRVGLNGELFEILKLRTMRPVPGAESTVTTLGDARITPAGAWLRKLKLDELPQLVNVLRGEMSLVGPRPDVPGWADLLEGPDRVLLSVRPGITGPSALAYRDEEYLLSTVPDPETYNREVIWPDKVRINCQYVENYSLHADLQCLVATVRSVLSREEEPTA
jgi:lipopolysaccharide/colanic/teichoic acid biosynthesis glycosyltransferase